MNYQLRVEKNKNAEATEVENTEKFETLPLYKNLDDFARKVGKEKLEGKGREIFIEPLGGENIDTRVAQNMRNFRLLAVAEQSLYFQETEVLATTSQYQLSNHPNNFNRKEESRYFNKFGIKVPKTKSARPQTNQKRQSPEHTLLARAHRGTGFLFKCYLINDLVGIREIWNLRIKHVLEEVRYM